MTELRLCAYQTAKEPFYVSSVDIRFYSVEELCYFFQRSVPLTDRTILNTELTRWMSGELGMKETALTVERTLLREQGLADAVLLIFRSVGYLSKEEMNRYAAAFTLFQKLPETEKKKRKADALLAMGRIGTAIRTYRQLLTADPENGEMWYALGCAQMRMFLFDEAVEAFRRAQGLPEEKKTRRALGRAVCLSYPEEKALTLLQDGGFSGEEIRLLQEEIFEARRSAGKTISITDPFGELAETAARFHREAEI